MYYLKSSGIKLWFCSYKSYFTETKAVNYGQIYVALRQEKSSNGLHLLGEIFDKTIKV